MDPIDLLSDGDESHKELPDYGSDVLGSEGLTLGHVVLLGALVLGLVWYLFGDRLASMMNSSSPSFGGSAAAAASVDKEELRRRRLNALTARGGSVDRGTDGSLDAAPASQDPAPSTMTTTTATKTESATCVPSTTKGDREFSLQVRALLLGQTTFKTVEGLRASMTVAELRSEIATAYGVEGCKMELFLNNQELEKPHHKLERFSFTPSTILQARFMNVPPAAAAKALAAAKATPASPATPATGPAPKAASILTSKPPVTAAAIPSSSAALATATVPNATQAAAPPAAAAAAAAVAKAPVAILPSSSSPPAATSPVAAAASSTSASSSAGAASASASASALASSNRWSMKAQGSFRGSFTHVPLENIPTSTTVLELGPMILEAFGAKDMTIRLFFMGRELSKAPEPVQATTDLVAAGLRDGCVVNVLMKPKEKVPEAATDMMTVCDPSTGVCRLEPVGSSMTATLAPTSTSASPAAVSGSISNDEEMTTVCDPVTGTCRLVPAGSASASAFFSSSSSSTNPGPLITRDDPGALSAASEAAAGVTQQEQPQQQPQQQAALAQVTPEEAWDAMAEVEVQLANASDPDAEESVRSASAILRQMLTAVVHDSNPILLEFTSLANPEFAKIWAYDKTREHLIAILSDSEAPADSGTTAPAAAASSSSP